MTAEMEERLREMTLRMVLWDEPREEILHKLAVGGAEGDEVDAIYQNCLRERVAVIRKQYAGKMVTGALWIAGGIVLALLFLFLQGRVYVFVVIPFLIGAWKLIDGAAGMLMAGSKRGSVTEIE